MTREDEVPTPIPRSISQGHRDVSFDTACERRVVTVEAIRTWYVGDVESEFIHHDVEASFRKTAMMPFLIAVESPGAAFVQEEVRERLVEPHDLAIVAAENGVQPVQDTLSYAVVQQGLVSPTTCVEYRDGDRCRSALNGADEGVENVQGVVESLFVVGFSWVYKRRLQNWR
jgi:hypothetical protein